MLKQKPPITRGRIRLSVLAGRGFLDQFFDARVKVEKSENKQESEYQQ